MLPELCNGNVPLAEAEVNSVQKVPICWFNQRTAALLLPEQPILLEPETMIYMLLSLVMQVPCSGPALSGELEMKKEMQLFKPPTWVTLSQDPPRLLVPVDGMHSSPG